MKNLTYSISERNNNGEYKNVFSIKKIYQLRRTNVLLEDGEYPFILEQTSWAHKDELKKSNKITNIQHHTYPDFTTQVVEGTIKIKNGRLIVSHLDKQIPSIYQYQNNHIFLEGLYMDKKTNKIRLMMGS